MAASGRGRAVARARPDRPSWAGWSAPWSPPRPAPRQLHAHAGGPSSMAPRSAGPHAGTRILHGGRRRPVHPRDPVARPGRGSDGHYTGSEQGSESLIRTLALLMAAGAGQALIARYVPASRSTTGARASRYGSWMVSQRTSLARRPQPPALSMRRRNTSISFLVWRSPVPAAT